MTRPPKDYRPPSKRRLQVEAWGVGLTLLIVLWCLIGGIWLGLKMVLGVLWALLHL